MPHSIGVSARTLKNLTLSFVMLAGISSASTKAMASTVAISAPEQIAQALDASLAARVEQRLGTVPQDRIDVDYQVQSAVETFSPCLRSVGIEWRGDLLNGRQTARAFCTEPGWQLYVPVTLAIRMPVVVAAGSLSRGHRLTEADLAIDLRDVAGLRTGYYDAKSDLTGFELARNLAPGDVITAYVAEPPKMIGKGDRVVIIATSGGLSVRTMGEALREGRAGQQIPVRNLTSRKIVHAYVKEKGVVEIVH